MKLRLPSRGPLKVRREGRLTCQITAAKIILLGKGHFVSTVGIDERVIREYIRSQEQNDQNYDQGRLFKQHQQLDQLNYRFERFTMEASGFAGGDSLARSQLR